MHLKWKSEEMQMSVEDFAIKGKHNQYNSMAASMAATAMDIRKEKIREATIINDTRRRESRRSYTREEYNMNGEKGNKWMGKSMNSSRLT